MNKIINNPYLHLLARLIVGLTFIVAGISKIADPKHFVTEIFNYELLPYSVLNIVAIFVPWLEIIAALFFISGVKVKANSVVLGSFLLMFIIMVSSAILRGLEINCGCFGNSAEVIVNWGKVAENTGLLALTVLTYYSTNKCFCLGD